jgi:outer membrane protein assembly factor BamB
MVLLDRSVIPPAVLFLALPAIVTAWTLWLALVQTKSARTRRLGMLTIATLVWASTLLVRMDGLSGGTTGVFHWRWTASGEDRFLAERKQAPSDRPAAPVAAQPLVAAADDWPEYRGGARDATVVGVKIVTDWKTAPPEQVWRRRVGPGWSSIVIVAGRLFTQEQRGEIEAVVCYDAATGDEVWVHEDKTRFSEALGGDGPRATPTFADGVLYTLGANGALNALDAATGAVKWSRNIVTDVGAPIPQWGFTSSPLVVAGRVVVFAGGEKEESLLAYDAPDGTPVWKAAPGKHSYSSPQLVSLDGQEQLLFVSDVELSALDPATGRTLWRFPASGGQGQPSIQAHAIGPSQLLVSFNADAGTVLLDVAHNGGQWQTNPKWTTKNLKPFFNDFVRFQGSLYGFDGTIFSCVDLETGERLWKKGRYGAGQVLLLADQGLLLVLSEQGEVVLVAADPKQLRELGRFQAIDGKTWNHPTLARDRLYVRNAEEMACYRLKLEP